MAQAGERPRRDAERTEGEGAQQGAASRSSVPREGGAGGSWKWGRLLEQTPGSLLFPTSST